MWRYNSDMDENESLTSTIERREEKMKENSLGRNFVLINIETIILRTETGMKTDLCGVTIPTLMRVNLQFLTFCIPSHLVHKGTDREMLLTEGKTQIYLNVNKMNYF